MNAVQNMIEPRGATTWITGEWQQTCKGDPNDKVAEKAAMLVLLRSDDDIMIPGYDFVS